ncbi:MAG TPA: hypothetical protein VF746_20185 [Longimicrobium sp.]|jgi:hypothetical protein
MLIPRFWSRADSQAVTPDGKQVQFHVWRGSRSDPAEADALAREAVERIAGRIRRGEGFPERYSYGDRPLREEVVRELPGATEAEPEVAITRNSYGALVLNAARVFFIDVDVAPAEAPPSAPAAASPVDALFDAVDSLPLPGAVKSLFGSFRPPATPSTPPPAPADPRTAALERLRGWLGGHPEWRVRVYRTHSGLRYAVTHALFGPTDEEALKAMSVLGADPQYVRLCRAQKSFRARLTPKPWRVGIENPPARFPYETPDDERAMRGWEARYAQASQRFATCELLEELGGGTEHPEVVPIISLHDEHTRVGSTLPLA